MSITSLTPATRPCSGPATRSSSSLARPRTPYPSTSRKAPIAGSSSATLPRQPSTTSLTESAPAATAAMASVPASTGPASAGSAGEPLIRHRSRAGPASRPTMWSIALRPGPDAGGCRGPTVIGRTCRAKRASSPSVLGAVPIAHSTSRPRPSLASRSAAMAARAVTSASPIDQSCWRAASTGRACTPRPSASSRCSVCLRPRRERYCCRVILLISNRSGTTSPPTTASPSP